MLFKTINCPKCFVRPQKCPIPDLSDSGEWGRHFQDDKTLIPNTQKFGAVSSQRQVIPQLCAETAALVCSIDLWLENRCTCRYHSLSTKFSDSLVLKTIRRKKEGSSHNATTYVGLTDGKNLLSYTNKSNLKAISEDRDIFFSGAFSSYSSNITGLAPEAGLTCILFCEHPWDAIRTMCFWNLLM